MEQEDRNHQPSKAGSGSDRAGIDYGSSTLQPGLSGSALKILEQYRTAFHEELHEKSVPLWKNDGVDTEFGGFAAMKPVRLQDAAGWPYMDGDGNITSTNKKLYHQGRIFWLYSYLYTHITPDEQFLKAAEQGYEFLKTHAMGPQVSWYSEVTREGEPVAESYTIMANIYMTLALGEFYNATGRKDVRKLALASAYRITDIVLAPGYLAQGHSPFFEEIDSYREPGTRRLGIWLHYLNALTSTLRYIPDEGLEKIARMCVRNILRRHYQENLGLPFEFLQFDYTPYPADYLSDLYVRMVDGFHGIESAWMTMDEALRCGSPGMFREAAVQGRSILEKLWFERDGLQGLARYYYPDLEDPFSKAMVLGPYATKELMVYLLMVVEHTGEDWAVEWLDRLYGEFYRKPVDFPLFDTLHNVRALLFGLQILTRIDSRDGSLSDFFDRGEQPPQEKTASDLSTAAFQRP